MPIFLLFVCLVAVHLIKKKGENSSTGV